MPHANAEQQAQMPAMSKMATYTADLTSCATPDVREAGIDRNEPKVRALLTGRLVRKAAKNLKALVIGGLSSWEPGHHQWESQVQQHAWPSYRAVEQEVPDSVRSVAEHLARAADSTHPAQVEGRSIHPDAAAAVEWIVGLGSTAAIARARNARMAAIRRAKVTLRPVRNELRQLQPDYIRRMPSPVDSPLLVALCVATGAPDGIELGVGFVMGFDAIGVIPASGWWPPEPEPDMVAARAKTGRPACTIEHLDHEGWHLRMEATLKAEWRDPDTATRANVRSVYEKTMLERENGMCHGPFTRAKLESAYGTQFRAMRRFGIEQHGSIRACDNARTAEHNAVTTRLEHMINETADFPARAAATFADVVGRPVVMLGGTSDVAAFYRQVPTNSPNYTPFALSNPTTGAIEYYTLPSFNFGLASAPAQCNRFSEAGVLIARRFLGVCTAKFFDDFVVAEWAVSAVGAQETLIAFMESIGMPFAPKKHVPVSSKFIFLGVETDFGCLGTEFVRMRVRPDRVARLVERLQGILDRRCLPTAMAQSLCGKLQFALSWGFCKLGRGVLQPIFKRAQLAPAKRRFRRGARGAADEAELSQGEQLAIQFFVDFLPEMPPYAFQVMPDAERPALIWTDGAAEPTSARPFSVGYVVAIPKAGAPSVGEGLSGLAALREYYDVVHSSAELSPELMGSFKPRKQQIGQVELVGALVPYLSLGMRLRGRRVLHWIDNSSAVAASCKGYSGATDSARIVHAMHATLAGLGIRAWFEYVRTDANVSDKPSREDLSSVRYALGDCMSDAILAELVSVPAPSVLPTAARLAGASSYWLDM